MVTARDVMTEDVKTVSPDEEVGTVLTKLARADFDGFPVVEDGQVVGIVTRRDVIDIFQPSDRVVWFPVGLPPFTEVVDVGIDLSWNELDVGMDLRKHAGKPVSTVMTESVVAVSPDDDLDALLALLTDRDLDVNRLPVVEDGDLVGIVARQDVLEALRDERNASLDRDLRAHRELIRG